MEGYTCIFVQLVIFCSSLAVDVVVNIILIIYLFLSFCFDFY